MSTPRMTIEPLSGLSSPISDFRNTDLPVPDGPSSTDTSPGGRVEVTSAHISCLPNDFVSSEMATSMPMLTLPDARQDTSPRDRHNRSTSWVLAGDGPATRGSFDADEPTGGGQVAEAAEAHLRPRRLACQQIKHMQSSHQPDRG